MLSADLGAMQDAMETRCGVRPQAFVYPFGGVDNASGPVLRALDSAPRSLATSTSTPFRAIRNVCGCSGATTGRTGSARKNLWQNSRLIDSNRLR